MSGLRRSWTRRTAQITAAGLLAASGSMFFASTALAAAAAGGNNGTVKLGSAGVPFTNANDPHLTCPIQIQWDGFDPGTQTFDVAIATTAPTGGTVTVSGDPVHGTFVVQPFTQQYSLSFAGGANPNNKGEYHVSITVNTTSSTGTSDVKHKTVWVGGCAAAPSGGSVSVTGACTTNTLGSGYTWTVTAIPATPGGGADITGTFTPPAASTWSTTNGTGTFTSTANSVTVAIDAAFTGVGWSLTGQPTPVAGNCGTPTNLVLSGACTANTPGQITWTVTNPNAVQVTGLSAQSTPPGVVVSNLSGTTLNASGGTATFTTPAPLPVGTTMGATGTAAGQSVGSNAPGFSGTCTNAGQPEVAASISFSDDCTGITADFTSADQHTSTFTVTTPLGGSDTVIGSGSKHYDADAAHAHIAVTDDKGGTFSHDWVDPGTCNPGQAAPRVSEANHCKSGMNLTLSNMNGTAPATFTVVDPDGNVQTVVVRAGQLKKLVFAIKEDTTGTISVTAKGGSKQQFAYKKNCATVLGVKHTRKPPHKPVVQGEHQQLPFTGFDAKRALLGGSVVFFLGAVLCMLGARRQEEERLYY